MRKRISGMAAAILFSLGMGTVCGAQTDVSMEDFQKVADEYARILLRMDGDSALLDEAYEAVGTYLESPDLDQLEKTAAVMENSFDQLYEQYEEVKDYEMPEEIFDLLEDCGILYEEFSMFASEEVSQIAEYLSDLSELYEYLSYEATDEPMTEEMTFFYTMVCETQDIYRQYWYTSINYWFADRSQEELAYLQEAVTDKLVSFYSDGHEWDSNQANVEERMNGYLDVIADMRLEWELHLGEREAELEA